MKEKEILGLKVIDFTEFCEKYFNEVVVISSIDYNEEIYSVSALSSCHCLIQVKVYGTQVTDVTELLNMDVIVEFNPTLTM